MSGLSLTGVPIDAGLSKQFDRFNYNQGYANRSETAIGDSQTERVARNSGSCASVTIQQTDEFRTPEICLTRPEISSTSRPIR